MTGSGESTASSSVSFVLTNAFRIQTDKGHVMSIRPHHLTSSGLDSYTMSLSESTDSAGLAKRNEYYIPELPEFESICHQTS